MRFLSTTFPNAPVHPTRLYFLTSLLRDFSQIGSLRKEQKTCLVNLARGKDVFVILQTSFGLA